MLGVPQYDPIQFGEAALKLRSFRQELISSNMVNSDTPGFKAMDIPFGEVLKQQLGGGSSASSAILPLAVTNPGHIIGSGNLANPAAQLMYRQGVQPALDGNTVDPDVERSQFMKNSFFTEATLNFLGSSIRTQVSAITGQPS